MKYQILNRDPFLYKKQIIKLWSENLPYATQTRFNWLNSNSKYGKAIWFFAINNNSKHIAGMITVLPKVIIHNQKKIYGGIVGDIVVDKKERGNGLCIKMLRHILSKKEKFKWEYLYVIPNEKSKKIIIKAGFLKAGDIKTYVKPIKIKHYRKYIKYGKKILPYLQFISDKAIFFIKSLLPPIFLINAGQIDYLGKIKFEKKYYDKDGKTALTDIEYLKWRLGINPNIFIAYMLNKNNFIIGFIIFKVVDENIYILCVNAINSLYSIELIIWLFIFGKIKNKRGVYVNFCGKHFQKLIQLIGMFDTKDTADLYYHGNLEFIIKQKCFTLFSIDRNLEM